MLVDAGADVTKVEPPGGDPLRRWSASGTRLGPDDDGALFGFLAAGTQSVVADADRPGDVERVLAMVNAADGVLWSWRSALGNHPRLSPAGLRADAARAIVTAITPFGLVGPWAAKAATEFTLQALAGAAAHRGSGDRPPVTVGGQHGEWLAGMFAAAGTAAAWYRRGVDVEGELVDVSMLEALVLTQASYPTTWASVTEAPQQVGRIRYLPDIERTADGYVGFAVVTRQHWTDFCRLIGHSEWVEDETLATLVGRMERSAELRPVIDAWTSAQTTDELVSATNLWRIPAAAVENGATVASVEHLRATGLYERRLDTDAVVPAPPYKLGGMATRPIPAAAPRIGPPIASQGPSTAQARSAPPRARRRPLPFEGLRIAEFAAYFAGPFAGHFFALLGAEVIHVESTTRPDGWRGLTRKSAADDQWWEWSPSFQSVNTNKLGVTIDLDADEGRDLALRLVAHCDVVLENYSPRVIDAFGLGYEVLRAVRPDVIMVRMPAFGLRGPWRDRTGYAMTIEQVSGMSWLSGFPDSQPENPNGPADPIAGSHAAFALMLALEHRRRTGEGMLVEVPMVASALNVTAEQVIEHSAYGQLLRRDGNRGPAAAPQNLYLSADVDAQGRRDRWVAIAVECDEQWRALRRALGEPSWACSPLLDAATGRHAARDEVDAALSAWCGQRGSDEIVETLWGVDVPVAKVLESFEQRSIPQLAARGFFEMLEHPVTGTHPYAGYPARFSAGPARWNRRAAPTLGRDNRAVFEELVGLSPDEIQHLEATRVIGTRP
jgi:crotonobetainyl-CoA:carnitine CoA-transferase CaiB-like acyl-CoA transferase